MKVEYKLVSSIEIDEMDGTWNDACLIDEANCAIERAKDRFFETLSSNYIIASWEVLDEELK